jgi:hypothetical protein
LHGVAVIPEFPQVRYVPEAQHVAVHEDRRALVIAQVRHQEPGEAEFRALQRIPLPLEHRQLVEPDFSDADRQGTAVLDAVRQDIGG